MNLSQMLVSISNSPVQLSLSELISDLAEAATFETLTAEYGDVSNEEKETRFAADYLYSVDNGDVYYMEVAQDVCVDFHNYCENLLTDIFRIAGA